MKDLAKRSGLTGSELGLLFGVSRATASSWINGRASPHRLHAEHIAYVQELIERAIKGGHLPLAIKTRQRPGKRLAALKAVFPELF
jgi:transcriptional regulator with XRE-family HTH domain